MIVVVGDFITDIYVYGSTNRISPESPIPVFEKDFQETISGGAGNVVKNLEALGSKVVHYGTNNSKKYRYVVDNHIVFRMDQEQYVANKSVPKFNLKNCNYVVLSDYNKGYLHNSQDIIDYCHKRNSKVIVDAKKSIVNYKNADIVKMNHKETSKFILKKYSSIKIALVENNIGAIVVTRGADGASIVTRDGIINIPTEQHQVIDVTGAGDIFTATLAFFLDQGKTLKQACEKAVRLSSISVTKFGTYVLQPEDIRHAYTVFTNGCFDILHRGHVEYLKQSKRLGSRLIVGLNSDDSIRKLKGIHRPFNNQHDRKAVLESLDFVDDVIIFDEETPYQLIKRLQPDIITKGGDYTIDAVVGNDLADVVILPYVDDYSTTKILEKYSG
jgi:D-beta-D-heptose 7-phosphate kinase/D-beta-D-heptose 1-phosphate adenosyltransferase